jgi:tRNA U55 pseudouridine synthase TruB
MIELKVYIKKNTKPWLSYETRNESEIYKRLTETLIAKKINCCKWVKSIKRENLYNGYQKITVNQANGIKEIYIIKN